MADEIRGRKSVPIDIPIDDAGKVICGCIGVSSESKRAKVSHLIVRGGCSKEARECKSQNATSLMALTCNDMRL